MASRLFRTDLQTKLKKEMQEKLDNERMARDFPFRPQVNEWNFAGREDVLSHLQQRETQRLQKIASMQQQRVQELQDSLTNVPAISPYSKSLTFDQPVHLRLYSLASRPPSSHIDVEQERPRSAGRKTIADFEKLYDDAKIRRMRNEEVLQKLEDEKQNKAKSKKVVGHSLTLVLRKIDKDIQKITNLIWEGANSSGIITEALLADALLCTGFFKMDLSGDNAAVRAQQEVKALKKLCEYLQALRQLKQEDEINEGEEPSVEEGDISEEGMDAADAIDFLSTILQRSAPTEENRVKIDEPPQTQEEHLIRRYLRLHQTGRAYVDKKQNNTTTASDYSFQPTLNRKSLLIEAVQEKEKDTSEGSPSPKRYEKLYDLSAANGEKIAAMRKEKEKKGLEECTFKPQVNKQHKPEELNGVKKSEALYNMSKSKKNKKDELPSHIARDLKHCSFQPNLDSTKKSLEQLHQQQQPIIPRGTERFVDRIQQGHHEREQFQQLLERPSYPKPSALKAKPPSFLTTRARPAWEPPLLYVDIKLAHGRTGRIGIHRGDDPKVLAQNFANAFHLDAKLTVKLVDMLRMHIDNLENNFAGGEGDAQGYAGEDAGEREREGDAEVPEDYNRYYADDAEYSVHNGAGQEEYA